MALLAAAAGVAPNDDTAFPAPTPATLHITGDLFLGAEGALVLGGFSLVGEASRTSVDCPSCASDPDFNAAYVDLSYVIGGRRGMVAALCMLPIIAAFTVILFAPSGYLWLDLLMLTVIGFFIYPVINLIVIAALDVASKKAIGTAAGFIGLFGYIGRTVQAKGFGWAVDHFTPLYGQDAAWDIVLYSILTCGAIAALLLSLLWKLRPQA